MELHEGVLLYWLPGHCRRLGFSILISALAVPVIHGAFSPATQRTLLIDPRLPLKIERMHK